MSRIITPNSAGTDQRRHPRYEVRRPAVAVPLLPDGSPNLDQRVDGSVVDLSEGGMRLELRCEIDAPIRDIAVGVERPGGGVVYEGVSVRHVRDAERSALDVGGAFDGPAHRLFDQHSRLPVYRPEKLGYELPYPQQVLDKWVEAGVLHPVVLDRVQVCPRCGGLPTFRMGCRVCGSGRLVEERLLHHFACAHVDHADKFDQQGKDGSQQLQCPKCRSRGLIVGTDCEYAVTSRCLDCAWCDSDPEQVGHCLRCGLRFPARQAGHANLVGYDVDRLTLLPFVPAS